ncbi:GNAT family N-acetyltransferase [Macrococcoides canis]|uniref:GNAT family N-acetyltransferase n=1 Tax=Macrococcoides canis TaxID=1855823 RepID=A0AAE6WZN4_9STAP|nr:GNAT family N-acetyltransferase [Macrococcus canis]QCT73840.1 GNAT family N-acetyltransferase [Macrococcus canis]QIH77258.1 GNAT family N-acetyltransferase [Macrococcus canis]UTH07012.1 GNAT family N-acetyltransferase [Macrococcus canis]UTH11742.1 GNAT family N-acetyltransferase [Macrococcus canis]
MNYKIRNMTEDDIPKIQHIAKLSWHDTYEGIIPRHIQENFLDIAYSTSMLEKRLAMTHMYVAEYSGKVTGFANFSKPDDQHISELTAIYILPDYQRLGIGLALLEYGISTLEQIRNIDVIVEKANFKGYNFYKKLGFEVLDEFEEDFDGHMLKSIKMRLKL